jgi:hypothetical protein
MGLLIAVYQVRTASVSLVGVVRPHPLATVLTTPQLMESSQEARRWWNRGSARSQERQWDVLAVQGVLKKKRLRQGMAP